MAEGKNSFVLYVDQKELWEEVSDEQAGKLIKHIFRYVADENPECPDQMTKLLFIQMKNTLKRDLKKYLEVKEAKSNAGIIGNLKRWHNELYIKFSKGKLTLEDALKIAENRKTSQCDNSIANIAVNVSDSVSDSDNVNDINNNKDLPENKFSGETESKVEIEDFSELQYPEEKRKKVAPKKEKGLSVADPSKEYTKIVIDVYHKWYKSTNEVAPKIDKAQGAGAKALGKYLSGIIKEANPDSRNEEIKEKLQQTLEYVFKNWKKLDDFNQKQTKLSQINSNITTIISDLKRSSKKEYVSGRQTQEDKETTAKNLMKAFTP